MTKQVCKFVNEWEINDYHSPRERRRRQAMNSIIGSYNRWQVDGFEPLAGEMILRLIEWGLQTIDGDAHNKHEELRGMKEFVVENLPCP